MLASADSVIYYYIPQDQDLPDPPNAFVIRKPLQALTLEDIRTHFPLPGKYRFRFQYSHRSRYVWLDLVDPAAHPPCIEGNVVMMKVTRETGDVAEHEMRFEMREPVQEPTESRLAAAFADIRVPEIEKTQEQEESKRKEAVQRLGARAPQEEVKEKPVQREEAEDTLFDSSSSSSSLSLSEPSLKPRPAEEKVEEKKKEEKKREEKKEEKKREEKKEEKKKEEKKKGELKDGQKKLSATMSKEKSPLDSVLVKSEELSKPNSAEEEVEILNPMTQLSWKDAGLRPELANLVRKLNFPRPFALQQLVMEHLTSKVRDMALVYPPKSGKTTAIALTLLQLANPALPALQAIVITETETAAEQFISDISRFDKFSLIKGTTNLFKETVQILALSQENIQHLLELKTLKMDKVAMMAIMANSINKPEFVRIATLASHLRSQSLKVCVYTGCNIVTANSLTSSGAIRNPIGFTARKGGVPCLGLPKAHYYVLFSTQEEKIEIIRKLYKCSTIQKAVILVDSSKEVLEFHSAFSQKNYKFCYIPKPTGTKSQRKKEAQTFQSNAEYRFAICLSAQVADILTPTLAYVISLCSPERTAKEYSKRMRKILGEVRDNVTVIDLIDKYKGSELDLANLAKKYKVSLIPLKLSK